MKPKLSWMLLWCFLYYGSIGQLKIDKQRYIDLLNEGSYDVVYNDMKALQKQAYGKCCLTDYFMAKSLCLSGRYANARNRFANIFTNYKLPVSTREFLVDEQKNCVAPTDVALEESFNYINNYTLPTSSVRGKLGAVFNCYQSYSPVKNIREVSDEELNSRLFSLADPQRALAKIRSIIPAGYTAENRDNFILVTKNSQNINESGRDTVINELKRTLKFYSGFYELQPPDKILTAYIVPDNASLQYIAEFVHGIAIPKENYGYSSLNDLSLLGISSTAGIGTLKHELFHLMVRADIGDIPAWLDEGIATLYEESHWENDTLKSNKLFWRTLTLQEATRSYHLYAKLPDLENLVNYPWNEFEGSDEGDICKASVNYAFAKHLAVYLEQKGLLKPVLKGYKNKQPDDDNGFIKPNSLVFEDVIKQPLLEFEERFDFWLDQKYRISFLRPRHFGIDVVRDLKQKIRDAKILYHRHNYDPRSKELLNKIWETETAVKKTVIEFDKKMKDNADKNGGRINENSQVREAAEQARQQIQDIHRKLDEFLRTLKL